MAKGSIKVQVFKDQEYMPFDKANVTIEQKGIPAAGAGRITETLVTDDSGLTGESAVETPPLENSQKPSKELPYGFCDIRVQAPGYKDVIVKDCQVYPDNIALAQVTLKPIASRQNEEVISIPANTLVGNYPKKIPEDPEKPLPPPPSGFVVLPEPVIPQYIVVHTGTPYDTYAANYTVRFSNYIKNVASCEIFSTWPASTIRANIYCILSFTLNRIYTEWYRGKGKNYDITNSTAFDHAFTYGRNIYDNISRIVDGIFSTYMKRPGREQPLLSQYCDGVKVECPGWLTQWGSKYLGDQGKAPYEILTSFYGSNLSLVTAKKVKGIPMSYPGYILTVGSYGPPVRTVQTYLNRISVNYPAVPKQAVDGKYGAGTKNAVKTFQNIFSLPPIGNVDYATWYKISDVYVAVTEIAELGRMEEKDIPFENIFIPPYCIKGDELPYIYYPD